MASTNNKYFYNIIDDELGYARLYGYIDREKQKTVSPALIEKYEKEADKFWDKFYRKNNSNFFKDRHWLVREFPEFLKNSDKPISKENELLAFEIGCGVGNTTIPLLELNDNLHFVSFDFSEHAVKLLNQSVAENPKINGRCKGFVYNAIDGPSGLPDYIKDDQFDLIIIIFVLSAMDPKTIPSVVDMCYRTLKPGGKVLIRDYAIDDMAQSRFDNNNPDFDINDNEDLNNNSNSNKNNNNNNNTINGGSKNKLGDNFHVRFDGTRAYYFSLEVMESLYKEKGFKTEQNQYVYRQVINRKDNHLMDRKFIQSKFIK
ncbi:hypothetical protein ACTFIU_001612 [Dictyostelium citrinum]